MNNAKLWFMSGPRATADRVRTWLFKRDGESSFMVRVLPRADGPAAMVCDCKDGKAGRGCEHVNSVAAADSRRFHAKETK
jgi:hypothetical protein